MFDFHAFIPYIAFAVNVFIGGFFWAAGCWVFGKLA